MDLSIISARQNMKPVIDRRTPPTGKDLKCSEKIENLLESIWIKSMLKVNVGTFLFSHRNTTVSNISTDATGSTETTEN